MFTDKELSRPVRIFAESQAQPHDKVNPRDELKYDKAILSGAELPEELIPVRNAVKARTRRAFAFEKEQFERMLQNKPINHADVFMNTITDRMMSTHCGVQTAIQLEIDELDYVLSNFDEYFKDVECFRFNTRDSIAEEADDSDDTPNAITRHLSVD